MASQYNQEQLYLLLEKFRSGQCTAEEEHIVQEWFNQLGKDTPLPDEATIDRSLNELVPRILLAVHAEKNKRTMGWRRYLVRAAAAAMIVAVVGAVLYWLLPQNTITYNSITTAKGEKREHLLSDGSTVFLNAASELKIPSNYGRNNRTVLFSGEAFFSVKPDPQHPFRVYAGPLYTEVLGTSFNISTYSIAGGIQVAVSTGKVRVVEEHAGNTMMLAPGLVHNQALHYDERTRKFQITNVNTDQLIAWKDNVLHFEEASIQEIAIVLARHYNANIEVQGNAPQHCRYTISFQQQTLSQALAILANLSGITYETQGQTIIINPKNCF